MTLAMTKAVRAVLILALAGVFISQPSLAAPLEKPDNDPLAPILQQLSATAASSASSADATLSPTPSQGAAMSALQSLKDRASDLKARASDLAIQAMALIGIRYKYGGNSPDNGLDCSGLVRYVFKEAWGTHLPRTSEEISRVGQKVDPKDLEPGDLVFFNTLRHAFSHVGIYLGDRKFIHAPSAGGAIRIESLDIAYWKKRFNGARRISSPEQEADPSLMKPQ